jgi:adenylate cyclase
MQETERKFLVDELKWNPAESGTKIIQGYLSEDPERTVRVRIYGERAFLAIKGITTGFTRDEFEYQIPLVDAEQLMKLAIYEPVEKIRYKQKENGFIWEIDVFRGKNNGLILAEIELENELVEIEIPHWIKKEVTGEKQFYNLMLAKNPFTNWENKI